MSLHEPIKGLVGYNVQKVLPAVYDDSLSYYELLAKMQDKLNEVVHLANELNVDIFNVSETVENIEDIPEIEEQVETLQETANTIQSTLNALPSYEQFLNLDSDVNDALLLKVPWPLNGDNPNYGTADKVLSSSGDGTTHWAEPVLVTDQQAATYIDAWLDAHPEATTTVQDGSITTLKLADNAVTRAKLNSDVNNSVDALLYQRRFTISVGTGYSYIHCAFVAGNTYIIDIEIEDGVYNLNTFSSGDSSGSVIQSIGANIQETTTITFNCTEDASYIRVYRYGGSSTTNLIVTDKSVGILDISTKLSELVLLQNRYVLKDGVGEVKEGNTTFFTASINKLDVSKSETYKVLTNDGNVTNSTNPFSVSDFIKIEGATYVSYGTSSGIAVCYYCLYSATKQVIGSKTYVAHQPISVGTASYIRIQYSTNESQNAMVVLNNTMPNEYIAYGYEFNYSDEIIEMAQQQQFVTITTNDDIIQKLIDNAGKKIIVKNGVYNVIDIYKAKFGDDYFTNYSGYSGGQKYDRGLPLLRNTEISFESGCMFTCEYTGNNASVPQNFSVFAIETGVKINGLVCEASGVRNIIHDDFDNSIAGETIIQNSRLVCDSNVIAGGLGIHDTVIIEGCYIENTGSVNFDFSYHNYNSSNAQSNVYIRNNYLKHGVSLRWYGPSTYLSMFYISNNSWVNGIETRAENASATTENISVVSWCNEVRV